MDSSIMDARQSSPSSRDSLSRNASSAPTSAYSLPDRLPRGGKIPRETAAGALLSGKYKSNKVYVGNLPKHTTLDDLEDCFGGIGECVCELKTGFGFVEFKTEEAANQAVDMYHEGIFLGNLIKVELAFERLAPKVDAGADCPRGSDRPSDPRKPMFINGIPGLEKRRPGPSPRYTGPPRSPIYAPRAPPPYEMYPTRPSGSRDLYYDPYSPTPCHAAPYSRTTSYERNYIYSPPPRDRRPEYYDPYHNQSSSPHNSRGGYNSYDTPSRSQYDYSTVPSHYSSPGTNYNYPSRPIEYRSEGRDFEGWYSTQYRQEGRRGGAYDRDREGYRPRGRSRSPSSRRTSYPRPP